MSSFAGGRPGFKIWLVEVHGLESMMLPLTTRVVSIIIVAIRFITDDCQQGSSELSPEVETGRFGLFAGVGVGVIGAIVGGGSRDGAAEFLDEDHD